MYKHNFRGSDLENSINDTISLYREKKLALIQKIPTPITPIKLDKKTMHITLAYFEKKSTVDYMGLIQEIPVCFDAKETNKDIFPLSNVHMHQYNFMKEFEEQGGISFLLIQFTKRHIVAYLPFRHLEFFINRVKEKSIKSINFNELSKEYFIDISNTKYVLFIDKVQIDLNERYNENNK